MSRLPRRVRTTKAKHAEVDTGKLGKLIRLLGSDKPGEVTAAVGALRRALASSNLDMHDLAAAAERGLQPPTKPSQQPSRAVGWGPPLPSPNDWQAMCWWLHYHRLRLRKDEAERVADLLLGVGFEDDGRIREWQIEELRAMVARVRAALRSTSVSEVWS
jgi:hypothetical protein